LEDVAEAISVATECEKRVYVERVSDEYEGWRWSLQHRGGPYPLLRITARYLKADYGGLIIGFDGRGDSFVLTQPDDGPYAAIEWRYVDFDGPTSPEFVELAVREAFSLPG
jgi:hypothetical protein